MATKKITDLVEITTAASDDVLPIVDVSLDITNKITTTNLLKSKQDLLESGTNIKTINSTSLLGSGNIDVAADWGDIGGTLSNQTDLQNALDAKQETLVSGTNIKTINSSSLLGSGDVAVQETLVSGTNIKTLNSESLLGSGNIEITASPAGVAGAIQFSDGSAFASDATNLFWDDTNNRLGIGTNAPSGTAHFKGSGTTSATTSLLVQNSSGTNWLEVKDNGDITNAANGINQLQLLYSPVANQSFRLRNQGVNVDFYAGGNGNALIQVSGGAPFNISGGSANLSLSNGGVRVGSSYSTTNASAQLEVVSTTKGFLPPRMTTTQKNAIATPASGLQVYDTTLNQMSYYNGTSWVNF